MLSLLLAVPAGKAAFREWSTPFDIEACERPISAFLQATCPGSQVDVLSSNPLRVIVRIHGPEARRVQIDQLLQNFCSIDPSRGDSLVVLSGPPPLRLQASTLLLLVYLLGISPLILGFQHLAFCLSQLAKRLRCLLPRLIQKARSALCFSPAVVLAGVLCLGWPLWPLIPSLLALLIFLPRSARPKQTQPRLLLNQLPVERPPVHPIGNPIQEASIVLMSYSPEFAAQCFRELSPEPVHALALEISKLPPVSPDRRNQVLTTFGHHLELMCRQLGVANCATNPDHPDPTLVARTLLRYYLAAPPNRARSRSRRKIFSCPECDEVFIDEESLRRHEATHGQPAALAKRPSPQPRPTRPARPASPARPVFALGLVAFLLGVLSSSEQFMQPTMPNAVPYSPARSQFVADLAPVVARDHLMVAAGRDSTIIGVRGPLSELLPLLQQTARTAGLDPDRLCWTQLPEAPWSATRWWGCSLGLLLMGWGLHRQLRRGVSPTQSATQPIPAVPAAQPLIALDNVSELLQVAPLSVELGRGLLSLVDPKLGAKLLERFTSIRRHIALELGLELPTIKLRDNLQLERNQYRIQIQDVEFARGTISVQQFLAIGPEEKLKSLPGELVQDPTYGMPGKWIQPERRGDAERLGCMIFDPVSVLATHLTEVVRHQASQLLGFSQACELLHQPPTQALTEELSARGADRLVLWRVLRLLLAERVSIRNLTRILEAVADHCQLTQDPCVLAECARANLAVQLCQEAANSQRCIQVITLDPAIDQLLEKSFCDQPAYSLSLDPEQGASLMAAISAPITTLQDRGLQPILLTQPQQRPRLRKLLERSFPNLMVLSWNEIAPGYDVNSVCMASLDPFQ